MAESIPGDKKTRKKRQDDPSKNTIDFASTKKTKHQQIKKRKENLLQLKDGKSENESDLTASGSDDTLELDMERAIHKSPSGPDDIDNVPVEIKNGKKRRRIKKILFWRKKDNQKSKFSAAGSCSDNHDMKMPGGELRETESQLGASATHSQLKSSTAERKQKNEDNDLPWWRTNRIFGKNKIKAICPSGISAKTTDAKETDKNMIKPEAASYSTEPKVQEDDEPEDVLNLNMTVDDEHTCAICYDVLITPHEVRPCGHVFCEACLRHLQHATASRQIGHRNRRPAVSGEEVLVLCPVCRGPIQKCELKWDLVETIFAKCKNRYHERYKQVQSETRKLKNPKLPSYTGVPPFSFKTAHVRAPQRALRPTQHLKTIFDAIRYMLYLMALFVGSIVFAAYLVCEIATIGHFKFFLAFANKDKVLFEPETGNHRSVFGFHVMRILGAVSFFIAIELFFTLQWTQLFCVAVVSFFLTFAGYSLAGHKETILRVIGNSILYPVKE